MSSAFLYLAIVAIWAVFLVPAWVRRPHSNQRDETDAGDRPGADLAADEEPGGERDASAGPAGRAGQPSRAARDEHGASRDDPPDRDRMLKARRRMLITLITLTAAAGAAAYAGIARWWITIPPAGMLALYVLLLREVAIADAEIARARLEVRQAAARAARQAAERAGAGSQPGATIIDISSRIGDQLYDQYADAAARAVGD